MGWSGWGGDGRDRGDWIESGNRRGGRRAEQGKIGREAGAGTKTVRKRGGGGTDCRIDFPSDRILWLPVNQSVVGYFNIFFINYSLQAHSEK